MCICSNWSAINNKSTRCDGCHRYLWFAVVFWSQRQLSSLFWRIELRSNFYLPLSGCGVDVGPVGAASLSHCKQVCFQLAVSRLGSPLEPMKDTDAVSGCPLPALLWVHERPGFEGWWRPEMCTSLTGSFKDGQILFNWWRSLLHSVITNQFRLIWVRPKAPTFPLARLWVESGRGLMSGGSGCVWHLVKKTEISSKCTVQLWLLTNVFE